MGWRGSPKIKVEDEKWDGGNAPKVGDVREGIVMPMLSYDHRVPLREHLSMFSTGV